MDRIFARIEQVARLLIAPFLRGLENFFWEMHHETIDCHSLWSATTGLQRSALSTSGVWRVELQRR
jgi:hypothetical protein